MLGCEQPRDRKCETKFLVRLFTAVTPTSVAPQSNITPRDHTGY